MSVTPQKLREIVLQLLFSEEFGESATTATAALLMRQLAITKKTLRTAHMRKNAILLHKEHIDTVLRDHMKAIHLHALPSVERAILRLAGYELLFDKTIPPKVSIAEAVRMSKKFATKETAALVNAVLDAMYAQTDVSS